MWACCTCAVSDEYPDIFTAEAKQKVKDILEYDYASPFQQCSLSMDRWIRLCYNDSIEEIEVTSDIELGALKDPAEMLKAVSTLDINGDIKEKFVEWHDLDYPALSTISSIIIDNQGATVGLVTTARKSDPKWDDTPFGQFVSGLDRGGKKSVFFKHRKGDSGVSIQINHNYHARRIVFDGTPDKLCSFNWKKKEVSMQEKRDSYINWIKDSWHLITDDDAAWIHSLIDHDGQEIDFEFEFNGDKTLRDVLVYKREVKDFKVSRP